MAVHKCSECRGKVSDTVNNCPHCGAENSKEKPDHQVKRDKRTKIAAWIFLPLFALAIVAVIFGENPDGEKEASATPPKESEPSSASLASGGGVQERPAFDFGLGHLMNEIDSNLRKANQPPSSKTELTEGKKTDTLSAKITPYVSILADVRKSDGHIVGVTAFGGSDGSPTSGANILLAFVCVMAAPDDVSTQEAGKVLHDLLNGEQDSARKEIRGVAYKIDKTEGFGIWVTMTRATADT